MKAREGLLSRLSRLGIERRHRDLLGHPRRRATDRAGDAGMDGGTAGESSATGLEQEAAYPGGQAAERDEAAGRLREAEAAREERREMIRGIQELGETTVREVMVPRTDTVFLPADAPREELLQKIVDSGHSRIPVYGESMDDVVGILYAKDLLAALVRGGDASVAALARKPFFVPETKRIDSLLREMKRKRVHLAVAVDEYGGVSGIVSLEDIIEEIVGEIQDEYDDERASVVRLGGDVWSCDARADLDDLNEELGLSLPADDFESLGGYVFDLFGRLPAPGEAVEAGGLRFEVEAMEAHRITSVLVSRAAPGESEE